jgi:hypothetical protein
LHYHARWITSLRKDQYRQEKQKHAKEEDIQHNGSYLSRRTGWLADTLIHPGPPGRKTLV